MTMDPRNLVEMHRRQSERSGPKPALRYRRHGVYRDLTWEQYRADALACAAALVDFGIAPGDRVGLLAENCVEWLIADMGILAAATVNVPPHAPLTARQIHYQLADAGASWLFVSSLAQLEKIWPILPELPTLQGVVLFDRPAVLPSSRYPVIFSWSGFLQHGRRVLPRLAVELARRKTVLGPDFLATIMYTSGTTGNPKGVMLTHGNLLSNVFASLAAESHALDDVKLNWLPFSHIYARTMDHYLAIATGTLTGLAESVETVVDHLRELQPTHMHSVPRFYEKVLATHGSAGLREVFGPRIRWLCSGGAPLPPAVAEAFHSAGLLLLQGYGLTETSPVIAFNRTTHFKIDTVGLPLPGVEVRIGPDGEVLTRGPHVMPGYWNNSQATAEAIRDGWFHTGDLGKLDADRFLTITGRKKELLVLSNGKKVVPNYIEGLLLADPCIDQAVVCGEGKNFLSALVIPHWDNVRRALRERGTAIDGEGTQALTENSAVRSLLHERIDAALAGVSPWEHVKKFVILPRPFSVAANELTVSLKLRRNNIVENYREALEMLYEG